MDWIAIFTLFSHLPPVCSAFVTAYGRWNTTSLLARLGFGLLRVRLRYIGLRHRPGLSNGGERGIRTPDTRKGIHAFEARAFSHSAISPRLLVSFSFYQGAVGFEFLGASHCTEPGSTSSPKPSTRFVTWFTIRATSGSLIWCRCPGRFECHCTLEKPNPLQIQSLTA